MRQNLKYSSLASAFAREVRFQRVFKGPAGLGLLEDKYKFEWVLPCSGKVLEASLSNASGEWLTPSPKRIEMSTESLSSARAGEWRQISKR